MKQAVCHIDFSVDNSLQDNFKGVFSAEKRFSMIFPYEK